MNPFPMNDLITLSIADRSISLDVSECDRVTRARIVEYYGAFIAPNERAELAIHVYMEPGPEYIPLAGAKTWQIRTAESNGHIDFVSFYEKGWADRTTGRGELALRSRGDPENFLRVLYSWLNLEQDGLLLHASGVISNQKGYVFFGPSGNGKTTIARSSLDRTVLSDDLVIIKKRHGTFWLYGVPFRGELIEAPRTNASAELHRLFTLVKDTEHFTEPLRLQEAVARMAACVPFVMAQPSAARRVSEICLDVATQVRVQALHFRPDPGFWEVIDGLH